MAFLIQPKNSISKTLKEVEAAVNVFIRQLNSNGNGRADAAARLGQIGKMAEAAIPALIRAFRDQNYDVRVAAVYALKSIGTPAAIKATEDAIPALVEIKQDTNVPANFHRTATIALKSIGTLAAIKAIEEHQESLIQVLQSIDTRFARSIGNNNIGNSGILMAISKFSSNL